MGPDCLEMPKYYGVNVDLYCSFSTVGKGLDVLCVLPAKVSAPEKPDGSVLKAEYDGFVFGFPFRKDCLII